MTYAPEPRRCVVCDARNPEGAACKSTTCPEEMRVLLKRFGTGRVTSEEYWKAKECEIMKQTIRKERITKVEFFKLGGFSNSELFRLQSRGGAWRYYRRVD